MIFYLSNEFHKRQNDMLDTSAVLQNVFSYSQENKNNLYLRSLNLSFYFNSPIKEYWDCVTLGYVSSMFILITNDKYKPPSISHDFLDIMVIIYFCKYFGLGNCLIKPHLLLFINDNDSIQ